MCLKFSPPSNSYSLSENGRAVTEYEGSRVLNLSDGAGVGCPGGKDLLPSSRFTQGKKREKIFGV
jgi:hypothetical protein